MRAYPFAPDERRCDSSCERMCGDTNTHDGGREAQLTSRIELLDELPPPECASKSLRLSGLLGLLVQDEAADQNRKHDEYKHEHCTVHGRSFHSNHTVLARHASCSTNDTPGCIKNQIIELHNADTLSFRSGTSRHGRPSRYREVARAWRL